MEEFDERLPLPDLMHVFELKREARGGGWLFGAQPRFLGSSSILTAVL